MTTVHVRLLALALLLTTGCDRVPATQVDVGFAADAALLEDAGEVEVIVTSRSGEVVHESRRPLGPGEPSLRDARVALVPGGNDATVRFEVQARLLSDDEVLVAEARVQSGFVEGERRFLTVLLDAGCRGVACEDGQTCRHGRCVGARFDPVADNTGFTEPQCAECERAGVDTCEPITGGPCGCGTCNDGRCEPPRRTTEVYAGLEHTCARAGGDVHCWGQNEFGELGWNAPRPRPDEPQGFPPGVVQLDTPQQGAIGDRHTCWLTFPNQVQCWGRNLNGEFGRGVLVPPRAAVPVLAGQAAGEVAALTAGAAHTCALTTDRRVFCWGNNDKAQLARPVSDEDEPPRPTPMEVPLASADRVEAGFRHTCAIDRGELWCWGRNDDGQLGTGDEVSPQPVPVQPVCSEGCRSGWRDVALGAFHTCGIRNGALHCWGGNLHGQLGLDDATRTPAALEGDDWSQVTAGTRHTCAIRAAGQLYCWGGNEAGQLGLGDTAGRRSPTEVPMPGGVPWAAVDAGSAHTCAIREDGVLFCWGDNFTLQAGPPRLGEREMHPREVCLE